MPDVDVGHQTSCVTDQRGVKTQGEGHRRVILLYDKTAEMTAGDQSYVTLVGK